MADYNFDVKITTEKGSEIGIDTSAMYGYWERADGSEGGGLWFQLDTSSPDGSTRLDLTDYDGTPVLPLFVINTLRQNNILVDESFI